MVVALSALILDAEESLRDRARDLLWFQLPLLGAFDMAQEEHRRRVLAASSFGSQQVEDDLVPACVFVELVGEPAAERRIDQSSIVVVRFDQQVIPDVAVVLAVFVAGEEFIDEPVAFV
jgi:hypothetical protein